MLKKLEIAHMMDAYEEEEFVPEEEALVDPQRVRTAVMGRVRRGRTRRILLTAAVLALLIVINVRQSRDEKRREAARRKGAMQP